VLVRKFGNANCCILRSASELYEPCGRAWKGISLVSLSISIFGLGYVGSVSAACFAHMGHKVTGVDVSKNKVEMLDSGRSPIIEARME